MRIFIFLLLAVVFVTGLLDADTAFAADKEIYCDTKGFLGGTVGQIIGLLVALSGLFAILSGSMFGFVLIIAGAIVGVFPNILENVLTGMDLTMSGTGTADSYAVACP